LINQMSSSRSDPGLGAPLASSRIALVHDYLNQRGGAERVVLELSRMWPQAPIYTSLYRPDSTFPGFREREIRSTMLDRLPVNRGFRNLLPLYPAAFRGLGEIDADVVLASSSGWAHLARSRPGALHAVYCHTPARWLYGGDHLEVNGSRASAQRAIARSVMRPLRRTDRRGALRADVYIANSENVRRRIRAAYGVDAVVVPPPVDVDRFRPTPRGERLLVISRLLPYKHVELVVRTATRIGIGLDVIGDGPLLPALRQIAGPQVTFHGGLTDETVVELMQRCRAVCVAAEEDFGMVAVEAQAAGKPVIAFGRGGSLETVEQGFSGVFFLEHTVSSLTDAIRAVDRLEACPQALAEGAQAFSRPAFRGRIHRLLQNHLTLRQSASAT
jgi:glycosyltransferase involved in cell wall biosynthesis